MPQADGGEEVDHAGRQAALGVLQHDVVVGEDGREGLEDSPVGLGLLLRLQQVDAGDPRKAVVPLSVLRRAHRSRHRVAGLQVGAPDLRLPDENIAGHRGVVHRAQQAVPGVHYFQHAGRH